MFPREIYSSEHDLLRHAIRRFCEREIAPFHQGWEEVGVVPRSLWRRAAELGLLCMEMPPEYGGSGSDFRASAVLLEELWRIGASGPGFTLHSNIVAPYLLHYGSEALKSHWLPRMARGEAVGAIAMTEPDAGSDLQAVSTRVTHVASGLVVSGSKTFISNGQSADFVLVVARAENGAGAKHLNLILVEADRPGFRRGRRLNKIGMRAQDTSELFFDDVVVPVTNLVGPENGAFACLMNQLPQERLIIAIQAVAAARAVLEETVDFTRSRKLFGRTTFDLQTTRFSLARAKAQLEMAQVMVDRCITLHIQNRLDATMAAAAKLLTTELQNKVIDNCLQLHGGYGYMWETPVARAWADARAQRIYGGANEVMTELVARSL